MKIVYNIPNASVPVLSNAVTEMIDTAKEKVIIQCYSLTSYMIAEALARAGARGVKVSILIESMRVGKSSDILTVLNKNHHNISIRVAKPGRKNHNKIILIDEKTLITGSYNFHDKHDILDSIVILNPGKDVMNAHYENFIICNEGSLEFENGHKYVEYQLNPK